MGMRTRKLIGTVVMLAFIIFYVLFAMAVAEGRITQAPKLRADRRLYRARPDLGRAAHAARPVDGEAGQLV